MDVLEFDPEDAHRGQKAIFEALVTMMDVVERPLRRATLPEMPAATRAEVSGRIDSAIAVMSTARVGVAGVATELKRRAQRAGAYDKAAKLPWWVGVGDATIAGASFFGLDAVHKTVSGDYSKKEVAGAWASFGTNFIPVTKIGKVLKAGKGAKPLTSVGTKGGKNVGKVPGGTTEVVRPTKVGPTVPTAATPPTPSVSRPVISRPSVGSTSRPRPLGAGGATSRPITPPVKPPAPKPAAKPPAGSGSSKPWVPETGGVQAAAGADLALTAGTPPHVVAQVVSKIVADPDFGLSAGGTWLHTGGQRVLAASAATAAGGKTIEMTAAGTRVNLQYLYSKFPKGVADAYWEQLSRKLVQSSSGVVNALAAKSVSAGSVFARIEVPAMLKNTKVPQLVVHREDALVKETVVISRSDPDAAARIVAFTNRHPEKTVVFNFVP